jgi:inosose dehydratase
MTMRPACGLLLYPATELEVAAYDARAAGYQGVELHAHHLQALTTPDLRGRFLAALRDQQLEVASIFLGVARDDEAVEEMLRRCDLATQLGAGTTFLLAPSRAGGDWTACVDRVRRVCAHAGDRGLSVALHHHAGTLVCTLEEIRRFMEDVDMPALGVLFDTAHYALYEDDLPGGVRALGSRIIYVHLKDLAGTRDSLFAGRRSDTLEAVREITPAYTDLDAGSLDLAGTLAALAASGYAGWLTVEMETLRRATIGEQARANAAALARHLDALKRGAS